MSADSPIFFVCGTPSDRYGFEYQSLDGRHLPRQLADYVDDIPKERFPEHGEATHIFRRVRKGELDGAIYAESRGIHPNDTEHNRGAYIVAGCWMQAPLTPTRAMEVLYRIEGIHDDLAARRNPRTGAFPPDFQLREYTAPQPSEARRDQLADLLRQAAAGNGACKESLRDLTRTSGEARQGALARLCLLLCALTSATEQAPRQPARPDERDRRARSPEVERKRPSRRHDGATGGARWKPTPREIGFSAAGIIFGLTLALAVVGGVERLSEPSIETETTPSTPD